MIGVINQHGTKTDLDNYYGAEGEIIEHPLETTYRKSLMLVKILADKWEIPFDVTLYATTIRRLEKNRDGVWHSSSFKD